MSYNDYLLILFLIFVNSHSTHGTSYVNNPYYIIGDRTQFVSMDDVRILTYIGTLATITSIWEKNYVQFKYSQKYLIDCIEKSVLFFFYNI